MSFAQSAPILLSQKGDSHRHALHPVAHIPGKDSTHFEPVKPHIPNCLRDKTPRKETDYCPALPPSSPKATEFGAPAREHFHWVPAILQTFEFLAIEHSLRLVTDPYARYLVLHKPFWHDYFASADHFDMSRWGDGDYFLVNYIGHPLQGSITANIFIQNDPGGRSAKFGKSSRYWHSRLKSMAWTAAYSTYFEIGPVLSEAAIGSQGGYSYVPHCGLSPCNRKEPGRQYKPSTNDTGWVDFIVTPVVGLGWAVLEDALDAKVVDRLAKGRHTPSYNLLRALLTPSRSVSNLLAFKYPWYRYRDYSLEQPVGPVGEPPAWKNDPRWDLGVQFTGISLPMDREGCSHCRAFTPGFGFTFSYRPIRFVYLDNEFNLFPAGASRGGAQQGLFGIKAGGYVHNLGLFATIRPGFVHYDKTLVPGSSTDYESTTRFALDVGGIIEYNLSRRSAVRLNLGATFIQYATARIDPYRPRTSVLAQEYYFTQGNLHFATGYVFRF